MNAIRRFVLLAAACASVSLPAAEPLRVLLAVGGHAFETNQFYAVFQADTGIAFRVAAHPDVHAQWRPEAAKGWDVLVMYDMHQKITDEAKADLLARLGEGKGLVVMHHAIANYQDWSEYEKIIGARYYLSKKTVNGVEKARSIWKHDVEIPIKIADASHPITHGLADFTIHDETYNLFDVHPDVHLLAGSDHPDSSPKLVWAKTYGPAKVVYIQLGHDHLAYENPNFRKLVARAIQWVGGRMTE